MVTGQLFGKDQSALVRQLDEKLKNKWNFQWIEEDFKIKEFTLKICDILDKNFILSKLCVPEKSSVVLKILS